MNALVPTTPASAGFALVPRDMREAMDLAQMMSKGKLVPAALQNSPADCLLVIEQATRWGMSPFAVAQEVSVIQGKLMHSGKIVAAAIHGSGVLSGRLSYSYSGEGADRAVTVTGTLRGEAEPKSVSVKLADAKTSNQWWTKLPDQMLAYHGARVWGRRHVPEVMLGVYSPEEMEDASPAEPREVPNLAAQDARPIRGAPGSMAEQAASVTGRPFEPVGPHADEVGEELPLLYLDGRLVGITAGKKSGAPAIAVWRGAALQQIAKAEGREALRLWRQENAPHFASLAAQYRATVTEVEAAAEARLAQLLIDEAEPVPADETPA